jgi:hypothetical protein
VQTGENIADALTKPLQRALLEKHRVVMNHLEGSIKKETRTIYMQHVRVKEM